MFNESNRPPFAWFCFWTDAEKEAYANERKARSKPFISFPINSEPYSKAYYGSKEWANSILKIGIAECNNVGRVEFARLQEIFYIMRVLSENGYEWQARRLRNHYHLAIKRGRFTSRRLDSLSKREEDS